MCFYSVNCKVYVIPVTYALRRNRTVAITQGEPNCYYRFWWFNFVGDGCLRQPDTYTRKALSASTFPYYVLRAVNQKQQKTRTEH